MKKLIAILILSVSLFACSKNDEACYVFTTTTTTTVYPAISGYPQTSTSTTESCGLTKDEAQQVAKTLTSTTQSVSSGHTITVTQTCTYRKK